MSLVSAIRITQLLNCTSAIVLELQEKTIQYSHQSRLQTGELHELLRKPMNIHHVLQTCTMITGGGGIPPLPAHAQTVDTRPYLFSSIGLGTRLILPNPSKTWFVTKEGSHSLGTDTFTDTGINITFEGRPYLGAAIGSRKFVDEFVESKVSSWVSNVCNLALIAKTQPHGAYSTLTHCLKNKWTYLCRTVSNNYRSSYETTR